jgi:hypothetical protein
MGTNRLHSSPRSSPGEHERASARIDVGHMGRGPFSGEPGETFPMSGFRRLPIPHPSEAPSLHPRSSPGEHDLLAGTFLLFRDRETPLVAFPRSREHARSLRACDWYSQRAATLPDGRSGLVDAEPDFLARWPIPQRGGIHTPHRSAILLKEERSFFDRRRMQPCRRKKIGAARSCARAAV